VPKLQKVAVVDLFYSILREIFVENEERKWFVHQNRKESTRIAF